MIREQSVWPAPELPPLPATVAGVQTPVIDLSGPWHWTSLAKPDNQPDDPRLVWQPIELPCDMSALAFAVAGKAYAFRRALSIPADFAGQMIRIRCDGVLYEADVWIDGHAVMSHSGGFTTWDVDITCWVTPGTEALLTIRTVDRPEQMNPENLGGLIRPILLMALPPTAIGRLHVQTRLCPDSPDFDLEIKLALICSRNARPDGRLVRLQLTAPDSQIVLDEICTADLTEQSRIYTLSAPLTWDAEHPRLYTLTASLSADHMLQETVTLPVGFREISWAAGRLLVNRQIVKLRGVCYGDCSPRHGKAVTAELMAEDIRLFKAAHINMIRTAGHPPRRELLDLCDRHGIYVQVDAPFAQIDQTLPAVQNNPRWCGQMMHQIAAMVERDQDHPSLLIWGLGSECAWGDNFRQAAAFVRHRDGSRPLIFSFSMSHAGESAPPDLWSVHYLHEGMDPGIAYDHLIIGHTHGFDQPPGYALGYSRRTDQPVFHDEIARVACHDRDALRRDPAVREFWGESICRHWERIWSCDGALGLAIWSGVDDVTVHSGGRRIDTWGILDVWRRPKPEYWHVRRTFAPVRLRPDTLRRTSGGMWSVEVENRFCHTDLREMTVCWQAVQQGCTVCGAAAPGQVGLLQLPDAALTGQTACQLTFIDAFGHVLENLILPAPGLPAASAAPHDGTADRTSVQTALLLEETAQTLIVRLDQGYLQFSRRTGLLEAGVWAGQPVIRSGPQLHMVGVRLPDWDLDHLSARRMDDGVEITLAGRYGAVVAVTFRINIDASGRLNTTYTLDQINRPMPRTVKIRVGLDCGGLEEIGISYLLDASVDRLTWQRQGLWDLYPDDHIGRCRGTALRTGPARSANLQDCPTWPWSDDEQQFAVFGPYDTGWRGSLDFSSMKHNIVQATAWASCHQAAVEVCSNGQDAVRLAVEPNSDSIIDDRDPRVHYSGTWYALADRSGSYADTETASQTTGDTAEVAFCGSGIEWYGPRDMIGGLSRVWIDGRAAEPLVSQAPEAVEKAGWSRGYEKRYQRLLYSVSGLPAGPHSLRIEVTGTHEPGADFPYVTIDWFRVHLDRPDPVRLIIANRWNVRRLAWGNLVRDAIRVDNGHTGQVTLQLTRMLPDQNQLKAGVRS